VLRSLCSTERIREDQANGDEESDDSYEPPVVVVVAVPPQTIMYTRHCRVTKITKNRTMSLETHSRENEQHQFFGGDGTGGLDFEVGEEGEVGFIVGDDRITVQLPLPFCSCCDC